MRCDNGVSISAISHKTQKTFVSRLRRFALVVVSCAVYVYGHAHGGAGRGRPLETCDCESREADWVCTGGVGFPLKFGGVSS